MTKFYLFLVLLIVSNTFAQEKTYTFSKNRLQQVRKPSYNINPLKLKETSIKIARFDTVKTPTPKYAIILEKIEKAKKDSLIAVQNLEIQEKEFKKIKSIEKNLKLFLESKKKFKEKKYFLITAQNISDSLIDKNIIETNYGKKSNYNNINKSTLIFSDNDFNENFKNKFSELNSSDDDLIMYYQDMISNISTKSKPKLNFKSQTFKMNYNVHDGEPEKYIIKNVFKDSILMTGFKGIEFDYLTLNGTYIKIDKFYQKNKNIFLLEENIKNINFRLNNFYKIDDSSGGGYLLQNNETKEFIIVNGSLTSEYERTKSDEDLKKFNDGYIIWKTKYIELTKSADNNIAICNSILKRNTFINVLGQSVWNADTISKKDKIEFNKNYDLITEKLNKLAVLGREEEFYNYFLDNVKGNEGLDVYAISGFHSIAKKFIIE